MSNGVNSPYGLAPHHYLGGAPWDGKARTYTIATSFSASIFWGDPVTLSAGTAYPSTAGNIIPWNPATSTTIAPLGVFVGCKYIPAGQSLANAPTSFQYWQGGTQVAAGSPILAMVTDDPYIVYKIQTNGVFPIAQLLNANYNIAFTPGTGNTTTGSSVATFDVGSLGSAVTLPLRPIGAPAIGLNNAGPNLSGSVSYNDIFCVFNNHQFKTGTTGVGE